MKLYLETKKSLIELRHEPSPQFWDDQWGSLKIGVPDWNLANEILSVTRRYLVKGSRILEGGCGTAGQVVALQNEGFKVCGIDFAESTINRINLERPELDVRFGNISCLDFPDSSFDGYWSLGVIEHYWDGYESIFSEASRVIRPGGLFFLTFPCMTPLRSLKTKLRMYRRIANLFEKPADFYQFFLSVPQVCMDLTRHGFIVEEKKVLQLQSGIKAEIGPLWILLEGIARLLRVRNFLNHKILEKNLGHIAGHIGLIIARRADICDD